MARFDTRELGSWEQDVATLAGSLVHEVKNPLSTLNINAQLMLEEWPDPQSPREQRTVKRLRVMVEEIARIERIVNSFLRFTEQQILESTPGDLGAFLGDLLDRNREGMERRGIQLRFQPCDLPPVNFDDPLLAQAFLNLIRNAEQAMPEGGELIVQMSHDHDWVEIQVIDTGDGIAEDRLPRIFRPYFSSKAEGTALGLSTTLRIIHGHGGHLVVESEAGKGSRFVVRLPREATS